MQTVEPLFQTTAHLPPAWLISAAAKPTLCVSFEITGGYQGNHGSVHPTYSAACNFRYLLGLLNPREI